MTVRTQTYRRCLTWFAVTAWIGSAGAAIALIAGRTAPRPELLGDWIILLVVSTGLFALAHVVPDAAAVAARAYAAGRLGATEDTDPGPEVRRLHR